MKYAFDFLYADLRPGKPRKTGLTCVRDRMRGLGEQREFLETYAQFVDFAKISNFAPRLYSEEFLLEKLRLYQQFDVLPFFGGILFENAVAQGKEMELAAYLRDIGAPAIEISNNILDLGRQQMAEHIEAYAKSGVTVFVEWGVKYPTNPMDPAKAIKDIAPWTEAGAKYVILERSEIDQLLMPDVGAAGIARMNELNTLVGPEVLIFEAESQDQAVALMKGIGRDVNLGPNIDFELVKWLEPSRLGISREMGHVTIEDAAGRDGVRSWLESKATN